MTRVLDAAYPRWSPDALKANGILGVCRYVGHDYWSKAIKKPEYDALLAADIPVMLNFESTGTSWRGGFDAGFSEGGYGRSYARSLGHPDSRPVVYSADEGVPFSMLEVAGEYMRGVNAGDGTGTPQGFYGTAMAIDYLWDRGLISVAWQTNARGWEGNRPDSIHASILQRTSKSYGAFPANSYDENDVAKSDWGQHPAPTDAPATAPAPIPFQESDVILQPHRKRNKKLPGPPCAVLDAASKNVILYNGAHIEGDKYAAPYNLTYWEIVDEEGQRPAHPVVGIREISGGVLCLDSIGKAYFGKWA